MKEYKKIVHEFPPIYREDSEILILGSFPSVLSREVQFYYGHPRNRFWVVLSTLLQESVPINNEEKKALLYKHHIALWDVIWQCDIAGSSDSSITNVIPNDIMPLIKESNINTIYTNGSKAHTLYQKFIYPAVHMQDILLPSTSPANASWNLDRLLQAWSVII